MNRRVLRGILPERRPGSRRSRSSRRRLRSVSTCFGLAMSTAIPQTGLMNCARAARLRARPGGRSRRSRDASSALARGRAAAPARRRSRPARSRPASWHRHPGPRARAGARAALRRCRASRITSRSFSALRRLAIISTCAAGLRKRALERVLVALSLRRDQHDRRLVRRIGEPDARAAPRGSAPRRRPACSPSTHSALRGAVGLDEELDRAVAGARHRVLLDILFGLDPVVADAHELRLAVARWRSARRR